MQRITTAQRRARLAVRHRLAPGTQATDPVDAARSLVGFHASDPASVYLQARARTTGLTQADLQRALYEDRTLVRLIGMRRTLFVVPTDVAPVVNAAASRAIARRERRRLLAMLRDGGIATEPEAWLETVEAATMAALQAHPEPLAAVELSREVAALRVRIEFGAGRRWVGSMSVATRLLMLLAMEGRITRARPRGSWISGQYRWTPTDRWLGADLPDRPTEEAQGRLVERWLRAFGPGTVADLAWWTGLALGPLRGALATLPTAEVALDDGSTGLVMADDLAPHGDVAASGGPAAAPSSPWVALLPGLDATVMGWQARDWYLGPHRAALFDRNGNAGPTIWSDGRVVGGWGQRPDGEVVPRLLEDVGAAVRGAVEAEAAALAAWIGPIRVIPRFRTPLEQDVGRSAP